MPPSPGPKTEVKDYQGIPTLFIDGRPSPAMFYMTYGPREKYFQAFAEMGVSLSSFSCTGDSCPYEICGPAWLDEEKFDYRQFDQRMAMACSAKGTLVMPRVYSGAPAWWMDRYPEECVVYSDSTRDACEREASFASQRWRTASAKAVRQLIDHIEAGPWADRILGYHIAGGITEEFTQWGSIYSYCADYSEVNRNAFSRWLRQRYRSEEGLRRAWADERVTFDTVAIPGKDERDDAGTRLFYDPRRRQRVIDYNTFTGETLVGAIDALARAVKERTGGTKIVGCFFGYVLGSSYWDHMLLDSGYLALGALLQCPAIDFIASPSGYDERSCGYGSSYFRAPVQSIQRAGKLWINENDVRTHRTKDGPEYGQPVARTLSVQRREAAQCLTTGSGQWWFDMGGGWYDDEPTMAAIKHLHEIAHAELQGERRSAAEVAFVVDPDAFLYCPPRNTLSKCFLEGLTMELNRLGAPVDRLLLDDALEGPDYKLYILSGGFALSEDQRERVRNRFLRKGKTVLWLYAPGYIRDGVMDAGNIGDLTGIRVRDLPQHHRMLVQTDAQLPGPIHRDVLYGRHEYVSRFFDVVDPQAQVWGHLYSTGTCGLACKTVNGANSIYSTAAPLDPAVRRDIARFAGAHIYLDSADSSYINRSFVAVHTRKAGIRQIVLPQNEPFYDLVSGREYAPAKTHDLDLAADSTALYFRGPAARWHELLVQRESVLALSDR